MRGMYRYKPSKPVAVIGALLGVGMIVFALTSERGSGGSASLAFWCLGVVAISALNLWAAFSPRGSIGTFEGGPDSDPTADR